MRIGICDDDKFWVKKAKKIIEEYMARMNDEIEIIEFDSFLKIEEYKGNPINVIFMDIVFENQKKENGIQIASIINQKWRNCQIVFLTNYLFYATEVYETKHTYFILKEQFENKIHDAFIKILRNMERLDKKYIFSEIGGEKIVLCANDIKYFERDKRKTKIATTWGNFTTWEKIGEIRERLSEIDFVRCHNSYIIYLPAIRELRKEEVIMEDGAQIMISRNYRKEVKQAFAKWALTQMI